jgi:cell division protein FtsB
MRPLLLPLACLAWGGYFAFFAVNGETGLLAWGGYRAEHTRLTAERVAIGKQRAALEHRVNLLDPRHPDPDLADELVRDQLNVVRKDEVVVPLHPGD